MHTPGPWELKTHIEKGESQGAPYMFVQSCENGEIISRVSNFDNARLIAAAPELLEACEKAHDELCKATFSGRGDVRGLDYAIDKIKSAVAKAEGKE